MKFVNFLLNKTPHLGVLNSKEEAVCFKDLGIDAKDLNAFILNFQNYKEKLKNIEQAPSLKLNKEQILAPIEEPLQDIICLGINFLDHAKESARFKGEEFEKREFPVYFSKRVNTASGAYAKLPLHQSVTKELDYECELGVVLAKDAYKIKAKEAKDFIFGYTIINDISARDLQKKHKQFYRAKSLEGGTVMGPYLVSADAISYPPKLALKTYVNGELRQNSNTEFFIFDIAYVLEELSAAMRLKAASIISMGTPSGVGMGFNPPKFLKENDEVCCEIENLGSTCNKIVRF